MKKYGISKYILFVLMSFLSFFGIASASRNLSSGEGFTISSASFPGVSCKTEGDNNPFKLTETSSGYRVTNPEGTLPGLEGKVTCTYDGNDGEKKPLNYDIVTTASSTGSFGLSKDNQEVDVLTIIGQGKIIDISSSSEYILIDRNNCNESGCPIRINPDAFDQADSGKKINAAVTVKYEINGNEYEYTLDVNVDKFNGARLYPGGVGVCSFSSNEWVYRTTSLSSGTNTFAYYEGIVGAKLPDCTPSNPVVEVEFKGWSSGLTNDSKPKAIGGCTNVVPAGTAVSSGNYSACYEQRPTVQLAVREGNIENISDWKYSDGRGYYYIGSSTTTTTLPDIAFVGYNEGSTLQGWESNGVTKQPGDTIDLDGSIWVAVIDTTTITERDYNKRVYVNQTVKFTVKDMSSCPSYSDSFLSFKEEGGSCWVTGISATPDGSPVDVPVQVGNKTLTFKYTVLSLSGSAQNGDEDFIIDTTTNVNYSSEISDLDMDGVITEVPKTFYIKKTSEGVAVSDKLGSAYIYQAMWDENGVDTAHLALCIDPGRQGPGTDGKMYRRVDDPTGNDDFNKLFRYYIEKLIPTVGIDEFGKVDSSWRVAAQVTVRIAAMQDGLSGSYSGSGILKTHFEGYQKGANKLKELETSGNFTDSAIKDVLKNTMGISNTGYIDAITKILTEYKQYDPASDGVGTDVSRKITERQSTVLGSDGYEINYKGTISLPTGATSVPTLNPNECNTNFGSTGVQCAVNGTLTRNDEESNAQGKEVYNYDVTIKVPNANNVVPPKTTDEKKKVSFKLEYSGGNNIKDTYLAEPANGAFLQRMIVFDYSNQAGNTYIYFPVVPETCLEIPSLNPDSCLDENNCNINKQLFKDSGCCADLNDEVKYGYLMQTVCIGNCTTSTMEGVCKYDTNPDHADKAEIYMIKEGSIYNGGSYSNNIGSCIVNVSDNYANSSASFDRTDDNGNSINVAHYTGNSYCAVTCKEDWTITMDSFGNYVGARAKAAGTWFAIEDDIFIGGTRTCYTSYIDYDKYMNDLVNESEKVVNYYNNYNIVSRQYTDIDKQTENDHKTDFDVTGARCVEWKSCATSAGKPSNLDSSVTVSYDPDKDDVGKCYGSVTPTCSSGTSTGGMCQSAKTGATCPTGTTASTSDPTKCEKEATCPTGTTLNKGDNVCEVKYDLECKTYGQAVSEYTLETKNDVTKDNNKYKTSKVDGVSTVFNSSQVPTQITVGQDGTVSYSRKDTLKCTINVNKGEHDDNGTMVGNIATLTCNFETTGTLASEPGKIDGSDADLSNYCTSMITVGSGSSAVKFCECDYNSDNDTCNKTKNVIVDDKKGFTDISGLVLEKTEQASAQLSANMTASYSTIYEHSANMYDCQHFELYNTTDDGRTYDKYDIDGNKTTLNYANNTLKTNSVLGESRSYVKINTQYNPVGSYSYDEPAFMTILGKNNVLVENITKNDQVFGKSFVETTNDQVDANITAYDKDGKLYSAGDVKLSRNYVETTYYSHDNSTTGLWTENGTLSAWRDYEDSSGSSDGQEVNKVITLCTIGDGISSTYSHTGKVGYDVTGADSSHGYDASSPYQPNTQPGDATWNGGSCYQVNVKYFKSHYIKSSISNSSFYRNKGNWYQRGNDIKEHGEYLGDALSNANSRSSGNNYNATQEQDSGLWSLMGAYNVFPISLDTPRNLYQYRYSFSDIGSYSDGKLGRIMGNSDSIIKLNTRACFYEVFEEVCLCCGSEIKTYVEGSDQVTKDYITSNGYDYDQIDDYSKVTGNKDGILNIASSTFSLNDVASKYGNSSRATPVNWSDQSPFIYGGVTHMTDKGDVALKEIETKGENIYADTPEYSYYLTPASLSAIRDYNASNGYDVDFNKLKVYGRYAISPITDCSNPNSCDWGESASKYNMNNNIINFRHYGSEFLEGFMYDLNAVYDGTLAKTGNDKVCYVVQNNIADKEISNKVKNENCRWVDYITESNGEYFRLAFK